MAGSLDNDGGEQRPPGPERPVFRRRRRPAPDAPEWSSDAQEVLFESPVEVGADGLPTGVELEEPADEPEETAESFDPESISIETETTTVDSLLSRLRDGRIDLAPDFQRRPGIWSDAQQSRLIESLLLRIPVPSFYMAQQKNDDWSVVDGIQRLTAIARFMAPETVGMRPLALRGLDYLGRFHKKTYRELPGRLRIRLRETQLIVHIVRHSTPEPVKFNVFSRINTGGLPLTRQEIRHAMIPGRARDFLADLAEDPAFGEATGWSVSSERMADREMVLRFLAFRFFPPVEYRQHDFDQFLTAAMHRVNRMSDAERRQAAREFREAMKYAHRIFGVQAFRKSIASGRRSPVNRALFETLAVNLAALDDHERERLVALRDDVLSGFHRLMQDWDFERAISIATGDPRRVRTRFEAVGELFRRVLRKCGGD